MFSISSLTAGGRFGNCLGRGKEGEEGKGKEECCTCIELGAGDLYNLYCHTVVSNTRTR